MENKKRIRPLTPTERKFAKEKHYLITDFLKRSKLDADEFFDVVVFDFLLAVENYLNNKELRKKCNFESVSYMYMKRAVYRHFRAEKAQKRSSGIGADVSFDEVDSYIIEPVMISSSIEYKETIKQIESILTAEQQRIFYDKLEGYSLKEIAENNAINSNKVYRQFKKIKKVVADVMEVQQMC